MTEEFQKNKEKAKELRKQLDEIQESLTNAVIIDGVNVAGCEYYKGKCMEYTHYCQIGCKECTDIGTKLCHYKQTERFKAKIARLEQENKALKDNNNHLQVIIDDGRAENKRFREENKELKKDVQLFKCLDTFGENECHCACRCLGNEFCEDADKKINSYRSALEEIKEFAEPIYEQISEDRVLRQILLKINEVLNNVESK